MDFNQSFKFINTKKTKIKSFFGDNEYNIVVFYYQINK